jgi:ribosomal protein S12 methylthiotransferase accessory factor
MRGVAGEKFSAGTDINSMEAPFSPPLAPFGISRAGDITGLDIIGIPVWFATRPNARALSVSQGKGLTHEQARISAVMESIEGAVAEQTRPLVAEYGTPAEMEGRGRKLVPLQSISRCRPSFFDPRRPRAWVRGTDYVTGVDVFAPYELVGLDMRVDSPWDYHSFQISSSGLAAGPSFEFAATRALLELIERDAQACVQMFGHHSGFCRSLYWHTGLHAGLDEAIDKIRAVGLEPHFYDVASKTGLPVAGAVISRPVLDVNGQGHQFSGGFACCLNAADAVLAALLEAVQSRLTNIAGSRDDMDESQYESGASNLPAPGGEPISLAAFAARHSCSCPAIGMGDLEWITQILLAVGYPEIFFFALPVPVPGVHVVRALVPGLKSHVQGGIVRMRVDDITVLLNH